MFVGELLKTVELEHQYLVQRLIPWVVGVPEACPLGLEDYLVTSVGWQGLEKTVCIEMVVPILHVVRGVR